MQEIEIKAIEINKKEIERKLKALGAKKVFEGSVLTIIYDFKDKRLRKNNSVVRLRRKGKKAFLAFKKKISQKKQKIMQETESEVKDFGAVHSLLLHLGLKPVIEFRKKRTEYVLGKVVFEIDKFKNIPTLMEIESPSIKAINKFIKKLGIEKSKVKSWSAKELFNHYGFKSIWDKKK